MRPAAEQGRGLPWGYRVISLRGLVTCYSLLIEVPKRTEAVKVQSPFLSPGRMCAP